MTADEEIAPYLAKGCAIALAVIAALGALIYFAIRGVVR